MQYFIKYDKFSKTVTKKSLEKYDMVLYKKRACWMFKEAWKRVNFIKHEMLNKRLNDRKAFWKAFWINLSIDFAFK